MATRKLTSKRQITRHLSIYCRCRECGRHSEWGKKARTLKKQGWVTNKQLYEPRYEAYLWKAGYWTCPNCAAKVRLRRNRRRAGSNGHVARCMFFGVDGSWCTHKQPYRWVRQLQDTGWRKPEHIGKELNIHGDYYDPGEHSSTNCRYDLCYSEWLWHDDEQQYWASHHTRPWICPEHAVEVKQRLYVRYFSARLMAEVATWA